MQANPFSPAGRKAALQQMAANEWDLLVVGGGITGCGLARDATLRGLRVALVEQEDFGYGTSSRSSKLVHGGLRYMAQGQLSTVWESIRERRVLQKIAPHLVHPLPFIYPIHAGESALPLRLGFPLFDLMAGNRGGKRHLRLTADQVREHVPDLRPGLVEGFLYGEFITDDSRLTLENALSAALHGALVANHARVIRFIVSGGRVAGAEVVDELDGAAYTVRARVVVNATGPWVRETLSCGAEPVPLTILPSKGVHLLFPASRLPVSGAVVLNAPSGKQGFAIRRWQYVYVGTTDVAYQGPLEQPRADPAAVAHLLTLVQECFPALQLTRDDVLATWAGLRPLVAQPGRQPRTTSRHDHIWQGEDGLITVAGGKLTTYRPMAHRIMRAVATALGRPVAPDRRTAITPLPGSHAPDGRAWGTVQAELAAQFAGCGVSPAVLERLLWLYGARAGQLLAMEPVWLEPLAPGVPALKGEVRLAALQEMAATLLDFLDRRSALLLFSDDQGAAAAGPAARIMGQLLGWSETQRQEQLARYEAAARLCRLE